MTWRATLQRVTLADGRRLIGASFRGVPFLVDAFERTGGRRIVDHEFPLREDNYVEDLGRKGRKFGVDGYVLGADYRAQRDALLAALEDTSGPGQLVHPSYGMRQVVCESLSVKEGLTSDGGMARFALQFVEAPAQAVQPAIDEDLPGATTVSADEALDAVTRATVASHDVTGLPAWALTSAETAIKNASAALGRALEPIIESADEQAALSQRLSVITAQVADLVRDPAEAIDAFVDALAPLATTIADAPASVVDALLEAYAFDGGADVTPTTTTRAQELANQLAFNGALRQLMLITATRAAVTVPFVSVEDAEAMRDDIADRLFDEALTASDIAYPALMDLRTTLLGAVPGTRVLARIVTVTRNVPVPSLVLAHSLYGSVDLEADVLARNRVKHPGFVAGELRVLSDDV